MLFYRLSPKPIRLYNLSELLDTNTLTNVSPT